jgi:hypothetical protein
MYSFLRNEIQKAGRMYWKLVIALLLMGVMTRLVMHIYPSRGSATANALFGLVGPYVFGAVFSEYFLVSAAACVLNTLLAAAMMWVHLFSPVVMRRLAISCYALFLYVVWLEPMFSFGGVLVSGFDKVILRGVLFTLDVSFSLGWFVLLSGFLHFTHSLRNRRHQ